MPKEQKTPPKKKPVTNQRDADDKLMFELCAKEVAKLFRIPVATVLDKKNRGSMSLQFERKVLTHVLADYMLDHGKLELPRMARAVGINKTTIDDHLRAIDEWLVADPLIEDALAEVSPKVWRRAKAELDMIRLRPRFWAALAWAPNPIGRIHWSALKAAVAFERFGELVREASGVAVRATTSFMNHPCVEAVCNDPVIQRILAPIIEGDSPDEDEGAALTFTPGSKGLPDQLCLTVGHTFGHRLKDATEEVRRALRGMGFAARSYGVIMSDNKTTSSLRLSLVPVEQYA